MFPVYCHFLDREFANLVGYRPTTKRSAAGIASAVLLAEPFSFASLSGVHESPGIRPLHHRVLPLLFDAKLFASVGDVRSADEFLASRRKIYVHDRRRYPFYFARELRPRALFIPSIVKATSTTAAIHDSLVSSILGQTGGESLSMALEPAAELAAARLSVREGRAITFALFRRLAASRGESTLVGYAIRRGISLSYTQHHMGLFLGTAVLPGFPQLAQFDELLVRSTNRLPQLGWTCGLLRWADPVFYASLINLDCRAWGELVAFALDGAAHEFRMRIVSWKRAEVAVGQVALVRELRTLAMLQATVRRHKRWQDSISAAAESVWPRLLSEDVLSTTVIIQCVNVNERRGIMRACKDIGMTGGHVPVGNYVAAESLGVRGGLDYILVRTGVGSVGQDAAQGVVMDALDDFRPRLVAAVGIAFGLKATTNGDNPVILVASSVKNYERVRLGVLADGSSDIRDRGEVGNPDPIRLQKLRTIADSRGMNVAIGQIVSGEKVVDDPVFRNHLMDRFPDAVGGEMEASGVAAACARRRVPWLVVKAVSDLGDGSKSTMHVDEDAAQEVAAYAAMSLVLAGGEGGCL